MDVIITRLPKGLRIKNCEFGYSNSGLINDVLFWQNSNRIKNLIEGEYWVFARSKINNSIFAKEKIAICCSNNMPCCKIQITAGVLIKNICSLELQAGILVEVVNETVRKGQTIIGQNT